MQAAARRASSLGASTSGRSSGLPPARLLGGAQSACRSHQSGCSAAWRRHELGTGPLAPRRRLHSPACDAAVGGGGALEARQGRQAGPIQPAELVSPAAPQGGGDPGGDEPDEAARLLLLQAAIDKTYRARLRTFRDTVASSPAALADMRASLPPDALPQLEELLREAAALGAETPEERGGGPAAMAREELSPEEAAVLELLEEAALPDDLLTCAAAGAAQRGPHAGPGHAAVGARCLAAPALPATPPR